MTQSSRASAWQTRTKPSVQIPVPPKKKDITITNIYPSNDRASKYIKQKQTEFKGQIDNSNS
jgi:hypothetical protein